MKEPTLDRLQRAFRTCGVEAPPEYFWLVQHRYPVYDVRA